MARTFDSATEAAHASVSGKAISTDTFPVETREGRRDAYIVMSPGRSPVFVYKSCPSITVHGCTPETSLVDRIAKWEAY